jgi:prepilin-type N-terminal cleavage/methylation domain-containing protein
MKKRLKNKNGFTLVELLVVLVILAILAAVIVPTLTGYIERAREKNIIQNARRCLLAAQTEFSYMYGNDQPWLQHLDNSNTAVFGFQTTDEAKTIMKNAEVPDCSSLTVFCDAPLTDQSAASYKITSLLYSEGDFINAKYAFFDGTSWSILTSDKLPSDIYNSKYAYCIYMSDYND